MVLMRMVNEEHGELAGATHSGAGSSARSDTAVVDRPDTAGMPVKEIEKLIDDLTSQMGEAARELKFELAGRQEASLERKY